MIPIKYTPFINENGLTIRELKLIVENLPECDNEGEPYTVWIETSRGVSNMATGVWALNLDVNGSNILLTTNGDNK